MLSFGIVAADVADGVRIFGASNNSITYLRCGEEFLSFGIVVADFADGETNKAGTFSSVCVFGAI